VRVLHCKWSLIARVVYRIPKKAFLFFSKAFKFFCLVNFRCKITVSTTHVSQVKENKVNANINVHSSVVQQNAGYCYKSKFKHFFCSSHNFNCVFRCRVMPWSCGVFGWLQAFFETAPWAFATLWWFVRCGIHASVKYTYKFRTLWDNRMFSLNDLSLNYSLFREFWELN